MIDILLIDDKLILFKFKFKFIINSYKENYKEKYILLLRYKIDRNIIFTISPVAQW